MGCGIELVAKACKHQPARLVLSRLPTQHCMQIHRHRHRQQAFTAYSSHHKTTWTGASADGSIPSRVQSTNTAPCHASGEGEGGAPSQQAPEQRADVVVLVGMWWGLDEARVPRAPCLSGVGTGFPCPPLLTGAEQVSLPCPFHGGGNRVSLPSTPVLTGICPSRYSS